MVDSEYSLRDVLVGRRFLCVPLSEGQLPPSDITQWRNGVVRAVKAQDSFVIEPDSLQLLLEYSDVDWTKREWVNLKEQMLSFYVEDVLVWGRRPPETGHRETKDIRWPTVLYRNIFDDRHVTGRPGVFMGDSHRMIFTLRDVKEFKEAEYESCFLKMAAFSQPLLEWRRAEKTRELLISGKYDLRGQRVRVYRTEVTQWFTASVVDQDPKTMTLTVLEDTILQMRHPHPAQVEIHLLELDSILPELGSLGPPVSAFRPVVRKRHHGYHPATGGPPLPLTETEAADLSMWKRRLRQHTPPLPVHSVVAPMSTRMVADYAKNGVTWEVKSPGSLPLFPLPAHSVASPSFQPQQDASSNIEQHRDIIASVMASSRTTGDKQYQKSTGHIEVFDSVRLNLPSTHRSASHLHRLSGRSKSTCTATSQRPRQHHHLSSSSKSRRKASQDTRVSPPASSYKPVSMVNEPSVQKETDVASVLASMAALSSFGESNFTMQAGDGVMGSRLFNQHSVETILRGSRESSISSNSSSSANLLGNLFDAVGPYSSDVTSCPSGASVTTYAPDSDVLRGVTVSLPTLHDTCNPETISTPLRKQQLEFSHHFAGIQTEADAGGTMPRKKISPDRHQPASPPRRISPDVNPLRQSETVAATSTEEEQTRPLQQRAPDRPVSPIMVTTTTTSRLPGSMASCPAQLVRGCAPLSSMNESSVSSRSSPCRRVESISGLETREESLQPPAKRKKASRSSNRTSKTIIPIPATTSQRIPPLIMADPEAARIATSISTNATTATPVLPQTSSLDLQSIATSSSEMTAPLSRTTDDHAPLPSPAFVSSVGGPWLTAERGMGRINGDVAASTSAVRNPAQDNVLRFHRRLVKFKRSSKECHRLLDATATAETETGRYVWFGSPQGMRLIVDSTNRLARNLQSLTALLEEALEAVCSSQKALASGIVLPPLPPLPDSPPAVPVDLTSAAHTLAAGMSNASTIPSHHSSGSLHSGGDHWVGTNLTQGRNVLGELSVDIDTLAMLIRTPRLRSAEREIPSSSGSETPKKYILSSKGMLESEMPGRSKKKSSSQKPSEVDKLIQWPKHVTGARASAREDDERQGQNDSGASENSKRQVAARRRLTSDLGPNWKLDKSVGQKRATSESAHAKIKLVSETDHCSEEYELEVLSDALECRKDRSEDMPRSNSVASVASDSTIIDDDEPATKEQTNSNPPETVAEGQASTSADPSKEVEKTDSAEPQSSGKAEEVHDVHVVSDSLEVKLKEMLYEDIDAATVNITVERNPCAAVPSRSGKPSQESNKTRRAQGTGGGISSKSRKRPRETGDGKKDMKKVVKSKKPETEAKTTAKRRPGRPRIHPIGYKSEKADSKVRVEKPTSLKPKTLKQKLKKPKKPRVKVGGKDNRSTSGVSTEMDLEQDTGREYLESVDDGCRPRLPRVAKSRESSGLQMGTCTQQRLLQSCMDCVKALRRGTGLRGERWCRFIHFRKLKRDEEGRWLCDGFADPFSVSSEDMQAYLFTGADNLDKETASYILSYILPNYCELAAEEESVLKRKGKKSAIAWKRTFVGIRELCDICATTIFNVHWFCEFCGFVVCIDCHRLRRNREHGLFHKCHLRPRVENSKEEVLKVAQTIPKTVLFDLAARVHEVCSKQNIKTVRTCRCEKEQQQQTESSGGGSRAGKKGKRQSKNSHVEIKTENDHSTTGDALVNGDIQRRSSDASSVTGGQDDASVDQIVAEPPAYQAFPELPVDVPHLWLCDGRLLLLQEPQHPNNLKAFHFCWRMGKPVVVAMVHTTLSHDLWTPHSFGEEFGKQHCDMVNCRSGYIIEDLPVGQFWDGFEDISARMTDDNGEPMLLKLKDWPHTDDFSELMPTRFENFMNNVPLPEYTRRDGRLNLAARLPDRIVKPDLGPKMYNAYGSAAYPREGTTNLHLDMSDAVNVMVYVGIPHANEHSQDAHGCCEEEVAAAAAAIEECDDLTKDRLSDPSLRVGALWHIFAAEDAPKIRQLLLQVGHERGIECEADNDPIHDQCFYLDKELRSRLFEEYGVRGWAIAQCLGDAVFIPAGAPHQVRNLHSCIKIAEDFVSPEHLAHCVMLTHEFRRLSDTHTNHEDKLQIKNIIYHSVKDAVGVLLSRTPVA